MARRVLVIEGESLEGEGCTTEFLDVIRNIAVIIVSACLSGPELLGAQGFLRKPLDLDTLFSVVARQCPAGAHEPPRV